jgi:peptidoglycan-associated lipoprotein
MNDGGIMKACLGKTALVTALGVVLLGSQGCGMKWLQSDGDQTAGSSEGGWNGQGVNPNFPGMNQGGSRGELSGFSQNPSDEYLSHGAGIASVSPASAGTRPYAELTREEKAAIDAGLKDVFFGYDQWTLSDTGMDALNHNARWLKEHPGAVLKVEGHCDERGTSDYNMVLGDKRSKSARSYLTEMGISPKQVGIVSYGKERPFCMEHDESCYQQNRRGHVLLTVKKK